MPIIYGPTPIKNIKTTRFKTTMSNRAGTIIERVGPSVKVFFDDSPEPTYIHSNVVVIPIEVSNE